MIYVLMLRCGPVRIMPAHGHWTDLIFICDGSAQLLTVCCFLKCSLWTGNVGVTWELANIAELRHHPKPKPCLNFNETPSSNVF